mmetsp:Transcript_32021/g.23181  ORF Transcript_32021/g.23181 Transcript_32021/m.23181 type:complete len:97 (-) Transcript_32021:388-678(-)
MKVAEFAKGFTENGVKIFKETRNVSKLTGKIIAHALAGKYVFGNHTITLVGFSLGSQIAKSLVNRLYKLNSLNLVHNVVFLAGAAYIPNNSLTWQR